MVGGVTTNHSSPTKTSPPANNISQFFPALKSSGGGRVGRVVSTVTGDQVFIPNLNLEWSECSGLEQQVAANKHHLQDNSFESFEQTKRKWKSVSSVGTQVYSVYS